MKTNFHKQRIIFQNNTCSACQKTLEQMDASGEDILQHMNAHVKEQKTVEIDGSLISVVD